MPQITRGGKYIFGWSLVRENGIVIVPDEAVQEYQLEPGEKVLLISGSKTTGGFIVAKIDWIEKSGIANVLMDNLQLANFEIEAGEVVAYKGRRYCWIPYDGDGRLSIPARTQSEFEVKPGDHLLSIRGSNLAFVMGVKGPLIEKAKSHPEIQVFK